ncbi:hypothetical protein WS61_06870 [Burkholderia sp. ABCPW 11]|nr:hypothetical protein WS61_06870 [Burkholderia sp. ABCPW 11]
MRGFGDTQGAVDVHRTKLGIGIRSRVVHHVYARGEMHDAIDCTGRGRPMFADIRELVTRIYTFVNTEGRSAGTPNDTGHPMTVLDQRTT